MQTPSIIPADHANLWRAARAWYETVVRALFTTGFTAIGDGQRPEIVGWLDEIEHVVRWLLIAAALALKPGDIRSEPRATHPDSYPRSPAFAPAAPLPAFIALPSPPSAPPSSQACAATGETAASPAAARQPRPLLATDLGGELIVRFFVLQRVMANPARLIQRLALRFAARAASGANAAHGTRAVIDWAAHRLRAQPFAVMQPLAGATRTAALNAAAEFQLRHPKPG